MAYWLYPRRPGVTVIDRTGPVPVERELSDAAVEDLKAFVERVEGSYDLEGLDDDGNLK
jgi:hypothetical protein